MRYRFGVQSRLGRRFALIAGEHERNVGPRMTSVRILRTFSGRARKGRHEPGGLADERAATAGGERSRDRRPGAEGMGVGRGGNLVIFTPSHESAVSSAGTLARYGCPRTAVLPAACDRLYFSVNASSVKRSLCASLRLRLEARHFSPLSPLCLFCRCFWQAVQVSK